MGDWWRSCKTVMSYSNSDTACRRFSVSLWTLLVRVVYETCQGCSYLSWINTYPVYCRACTCLDLANILWAPGSEPEISYSSSWWLPLESLAQILSVEPSMWGGISAADLHNMPVNLRLRICLLSAYTSMLVSPEHPATVNLKVFPATGGTRVCINIDMPPIKKWRQRGEPENFLAATNGPVYIFVRSIHACCYSYI